MAQTNYTPIQLYYSTTAAAVPVNTNLVSGELAINIQDEKLYFKNAAGTVKLLASNATSAPVLSFSAGTTGFTPSTATTGAITLAGTLATTNGGTALTSFTSGGAVYATSTSVLTTGTLPVTAGGTGQITLATGALGYGQGTSAHASLAIGTAGQILTVNSGATAPQWTTLTSVSVTTFSAGTTGFTPSTATSGAITLAGTLVVSNGGTGLTTLVAGYIPYGNGTSAFASSANLSFSGTSLTVKTGYYESYDPTDSTSAGVGVRFYTDGGGTKTENGRLTVSQNATSSSVGNMLFATNNGTALGTRATLTGVGFFGVGVAASSITSMLQTAGSSSVSALKTPNIAEVDTISATAATGTINFDITTQSVLYYTSNASANWTVNFRGSSGTSLNTVMQTGESISATFLVTQGSTAYYNSAVTIDGTSVTPKWQGGTAPTSGNASSVDCYTYVIQKTGSATYAVLASQTKFA